MYPMPRPQFPPVTPANSLFSRGFLPGTAGQFSQYPIQHGAMQSGGFLSKILGGGAQAGGGGFSNIVGMLQNAQKAIGIFQQVSPMVQQYGPLVKSLPAIVKMMKSNGSSDEEKSENIKTKDTVENSEETTKTKKQVNSSKKKANKKKATKSTKRQTQKKSSKGNSTNGIPSPKLYI